MEELPESLRTTLALHLNKDLIDSVPFLRKLGSDGIAMLTTMLKPQLVAPEEVVIEQGHVGTQMFFVQKGTLVMLVDNVELGASIGPGGFFAEYCLVLDSARHPCTVQAIESGDLFALNKTQFHEVAKVFSHVYDHIKEAAEASAHQLMDLCKRQEFKNNHDMTGDSGIDGDMLQRLGLLNDSTTNRKMINRLRRLKSNAIQKVNTDRISAELPPHKRRKPMEQMNATVESGNETISNMMEQQQAFMKDVRAKLDEMHSMLSGGNTTSGPPLNTTL